MIKTPMEHLPRRSHLQLVTNLGTTNVMSHLGSRRRISSVFVAAGFEDAFETTTAMASSVRCIVLFVNLTPKSGGLDC